MASYRMREEGAHAGPYKAPLRKPLITVIHGGCCEAAGWLWQTERNPFWALPFILECTSPPARAQRHRCDI
ncbi:unnamed protein product, partial [Boreogadus saida]